MSELKISIITELGRNTLHAKDVSEEVLKELEKNFFVAMGVPSDFLGLPVSAIGVGSPYSSQEKIQNYFKEKSGKKITEDTSRSKSIQPVNSERTLSVSIGETLNKLQSADKEPEFFKTGIKVIDGENHYKCRYYCKNEECNAKGNHYIPEGTKTIYCYQCETKHIVRDANPLGFPNRDNFGNFYIADKLMDGEE